MIFPSDCPDADFSLWCHQLIILWHYQLCPHLQKECGNLKGDKKKWCGRHGQNRQITMVQSPVVNLFYLNLFFISGLLSVIPWWISAFLASWLGSAALQKRLVACPAALFYKMLICMCQTWLMRLFEVHGGISVAPVLHCETWFIVCCKFISMCKCYFEHL